MNGKGILFLQFVGRIQMLQNVHILKLKIVKKEKDCSAVFLVSSHIKAMENFLNTRTFRANVLQNLFCKLSQGFLMFRVQYEKWAIFFLCLQVRTPRKVEIDHFYTKIPNENLFLIPSICQIGSIHHRLK